MSEVESNSKLEGSSRWVQPLLVFAGFLLIGAAVSLVLFGGFLSGNGDEPKTEPAVLEQVGQIPDLGQEQAPAPAEVPPGGVPQAGQLAPGFTLSDLDGNLVSLADYAGRPVIVNFWATWCAPCRIEMPEFQAVYDQHREEGLAILALNQDEPADVAAAYFYDEMGLTFTPLLDEENAISSAYGSYNVLPSTYFIDPQGVITAIHRGPLTEARIEEYLSSILADMG